MLRGIQPTPTFVCKRLIHLKVKSFPVILEDPVSIEVRSPPFCFNESPARGKGKCEVAAEVVHCEFTTFQLTGDAGGRDKR